MTNKKRVVTSGKVNFPKWGIMNKYGELLYAYPSREDARNVVRFGLSYSQSVFVVRLSGTVTYTLAK